VIFALSSIYGVPFSAVEEVPVAKLLRLMREFEKRVVELRGGVSG
jgi:hypothetical protein